MFELLNRNQDLTGRTEIWSMVMDAILEHPWLGYGYHAFWRGADGPSVDVRLSGWIPPHAHNGFLDLALDFGIAGPLLFVCLLAGPAFDALRLAKRQTKALKSLSLGLSDFHTIVKPDRGRERNAQQHLLGVARHASSKA